MSSIISDPIKLIVGLILTTGLITSKLNEYWMNCLFGGVISSIFVKILKRIIKAERPGGGQNKDHGFPSSHTHQVTFFSTYAIWRSPYDIIIIISSICIIIITAYDRLRKKEHSFDQVVGGIYTGFLFGFIFCYIYLQELNGQIRMEYYCQENNIKDKISLVVSIGVIGLMMVSDVGRRIAGGGSNTQ